MKKLLPLLLCMIVCTATNMYATDYFGMLRDVNGAPIDANKYYAITNGASNATTDYNLRGIRSAETNYRMRIAAEKLGVNQAYLAWQFESVTDGGDTKFKIFSTRLKAEMTTGYIQFLNNNNAEGGGNIRPQANALNGSVFTCETNESYPNQFLLASTYGNKNVCMSNASMPTNYVGVYTSDNANGQISQARARWHFTPLLLLTMEVKNTADESVTGLLPIINNTPVTYDFTGNAGLTIMESDCHSQKMVAVSENITSISLGDTDRDASIHKYVVTVNGTATEYTNVADAISALNGRIGYDATLTVVIDQLVAARATAVATLESYKSTQGDYYRYDDADIEAAKATVAAAATEEAINTALTSLAVKNPVTDGAIIKLWSNRNAYLCGNTSNNSSLAIKAGVDVHNIWVAKATGTADQFHLYNPFTGKYAGSTGAVNDDIAIPLVEEANACPYSFEAEHPYVKVHDMSSGRNSDFQYLHAVSANNVVHWRAQDYEHNSDSYWKVYDIDYSEVSASYQALFPYYNARKKYAGTGLGQYNFDTTGIDVESAQSASTIEEMIAAMPLAGLDAPINQPASDRLYTIKSTNGNYACVPSSLEQKTACKTYTTPDPAINIWRLEQQANGSYKLLSYASGYYYNNPNHALMGYSAPINLTESNTVGTYNLAGMKDNGNDAAITVSGSDHNDWVIEEITELPVQFKAAAKGYATLWTPVALDVPAGVLAFVGTIGEDVIELESINTIPANTAVLLKTAAPKENTWVNFELNMTDESAAIAGDDNCFRGQAASFNKPAAGALTLGLNEGNIGFYNYTGSTLRGFSAYINKADVPENAGVRGFALSFGGDVETAIKTVLDAETDGVAYDLNGRRIEKAEGGIYIVNGKKIVVK